MSYVHVLQNTILVQIDNRLVLYETTQSRFSSVLYTMVYYTIERMLNVELEAAASVSSLSDTEMIELPWLVHALEGYFSMC